MAAPPRCRPNPQTCRSGSIAATETRTSTTPTSWSGPAGADTRPQTPETRWQVDTLTAWAEKQGIASKDADRYIRSLFQGAGRALEDETRSLHQLAADHETPKGLNERIRTTWFDTANSDALVRALDVLLSDLT